MFLFAFLEGENSTKVEPRQACRRRCWVKKNLRRISKRRHEPIKVAAQLKKSPTRQNIPVDSGKGPAGLGKVAAGTGKNDVESGKVQPRKSSTEHREHAAELVEEAVQARKVAAQSGKNHRKTRKSHR